ncbi:MAG: colanic acid biosynthesis glycosyl transferase WcaI [Mucilaginibacter sp.]|nr:colanic acid biosynthesis glycosyl transferase WcaI [Mucilaginibacter sp.]
MANLKIESSVKRILLISHNFSPELTGIGRYNGEMITWLVNKGYNCTVITTYPYYPYWKVQAPYKNVWYKKEEVEYKNGNKLIIYRCPSYIPANPTGRKRMIQDFSYWTSMIWPTMKTILGNKQYDLIVTVAPPFHLAFLGLLVKRITGGKLLYHIQDLQLEAAKELNMISNVKLFHFLYNLERKVLKHADFVSSISDGMITKIKEKVDKNVISLPNWVDTAIHFQIESRSELKLKWGFKKDDFVYLYSGGIGEKQGLEAIILAAEELKNQSELRFVICGSGPYKQKLIQMAHEKQLTNVSFLPLQSEDRLNEFLNMADIHFVIQKAKAGDLVLPSKLTTILAVGGASIVTCLPNTSLYDLINNNKIGYTVVPENVDLLKAKIIETRSLNVEEIRSNARDYALKNLNIDEIMNGFVDKLLV